MPKEVKFLNKIYVGTHGGEGAASSNIILPIASPIESNGFFVNIFGFQQKVNKVLSRISDSRDINSIILAFYEYVFNNIYIYPLVDLKISVLTSNNMIRDLTISLKRVNYFMRGFSFFTELKESFVFIFRSYQEFSLNQYLEK